MGNQIRISEEGAYINNIVDERLPVITNGLIAHYPFDGKGGAIDIISGAGTYNNIESNVNILDCLTKSWREPTNWYIAGGTAVWDEVEQALRFDTAGTSPTVTLEVFIPIITSKSYFIEAEVKKTSNSNGVLYLGNISYDINKSIQPGHPGSYDYYGASGATVPTTYRLFKNDAIGGSPRTGESSDSNYSTWHTGTRYAKIMILPNYSGSQGSFYIKNLKFYTTNSDTSNVIITSDGFAVQEASATSVYNTVNKQNIAFGSWGDNTTGTAINIPDTTGKITDAGYLNIKTLNGGVQWRSGAGIINASPNTTFTISCKIKASDYGQVHTNFFYIRQYNSGGSQITEHGIYNNSNRVPYDEEYFWTWATFTTTSTTTFFRLESYQYSAPLSIVSFEYMIEQRAFPTAFVTTARSKGTLEILIPPDAQLSFPFTATVRIKNMLHNGQNGEGNEPTVGYPFTWWTTPYAGILGQYGRSTTAFQRPEFRCTVIFNATTYTIYFDTTQVGNGNYYNNTRPSFSVPINLGTRGEGTAFPAFNGIYSDLSFYNRALTIAEITQLSNTKVQTLPTYLQTLKVIEKPEIPLDTYHFPLSNNAIATNKYNQAVSALNLVYEDGSVWVGTPTTNLLSNSGYSAQNGNIFYGSVRTNVGKVAYINQTGSLEVMRLLCNLSDLSNGSTYTGSIRVGDSTISNLYLDWCDGGTSISESKYISVVTGARATYDSTYRFLDINFPAQIATHQIFETQLENKPFRTPYTATSRGNGTLHFNLYNDIGLDWNGNWTICYWKKPVGTHDNTFTGYNIESIGSNSNSVGGGYIWWGKEAGANNISQSSPGTIIPSEYFNKWQFVSLVRSGSTVTITTWYVGAQNHVRTTGYSGVPANYMVTQYGYDLKLGGWDNGNVCNTYFRDLIVLKRAVTTTELEYIKSLTNTNKNGLQVNNIIENNLS